MHLAVDFDGTIAERSGKYPGIGEPVKDAIPALHEIHKAGHTMSIWTCRAGDALVQAQLWLNGHNLSQLFVSINQNAVDWLSRLNEDPRKIFADYYIDDRALGCPLTADGYVDWNAVIDHLNEACRK